MGMIYAGIVTYNPDTQVIEKNIKAIINQVDALIIADNGSKNIDYLLSLADKYHIEIITNQKNIGIAAALNELMQWGVNHHYQWMLSLDQDSICDQNYICDMFPYLSVEPKLGIVAPVIVDREVGVVGHNPGGKYQHVRTCITSGAIVNIKAWDEIGRYDEKMFIDSVDFDLCYRMRKTGFGVIQVRDIRLEHRLGESHMRRFLFWKVRVQGHSAFRKYYIAQNAIYFPRKYNDVLRLIRGNLRNIKQIFLVLLYEDDKNNKIKNIFKGWVKGYTL